MKFSIESPLCWPPFPGLIKMAFALRPRPTSLHAGLHTSIKRSPVGVLEILLLLAHQCLGSSLHTLSMLPTHGYNVLPSAICFLTSVGLFTKIVSVTFSVVFLTTLCKISTTCPYLMTPSLPIFNFSPKQSSQDCKYFFSYVCLSLPWMYSPRGQGFCMFCLSLCCLSNKNISLEFSKESLYSKGLFQYGKAYYGNWGGTELLQ